MTKSADQSNPANSIEFKILAGALGAVATFAVRKLVEMGWKSITGQEPPDPDDPDASTASAVAWVAATAVGVAVAQVVTRRIAANRYAALRVKRVAADPAGAVKHAARAAFND